MVSITRAGLSSDATATRGRSSPELDAKVRTYRAQLADWVTCPSAKTPEGKAKIEQISAQLQSVKGQIEKADTGAPQASSSPSAIGSNVDTYA